MKRITARSINQRRYRHRYQKFPGDESTCAYCGQLAQVTDHVPTLSQADAYSDIDTPFWIVPCCFECNAMLGDHPSIRIYERAAIVAERLRKRYWKLLHTPRWSIEDLEELGYVLQVQFAEVEMVVAVTLRRIAHAKRVAGERLR